MVGDKLAEARFYPPYDQRRPPSAAIRELCPTVGGSSSYPPYLLPPLLKKWWVTNSLKLVFTHPTITVVRSGRAATVLDPRDSLNAAAMLTF